MSQGVDGLLGRTVVGERHIHVPIHCAGAHAAFLLEQLRRHLAIQSVLQQLVDLQLHVLIAALLKQGVGLRIDHGSNPRGIIGAEGDVGRVAEEEPAVSQMLGHGVVEHFGELADGHVLGHEPGKVRIADVGVKDAAAQLRERLDFHKHFGDIVRDQRQQVHLHSLKRGRGCHDIHGCETVTHRFPHPRDGCVRGSEWRQP